MEIKAEIFKSVVKVIGLSNQMVGNLGVDLSEPDNVSAFVYVAERAGVAPWCYHRLANNADAVTLYPNLIAKLKQRYIVTLVDNRNRLDLYNKIVLTLKENGVNVAMLKGMALAFTKYPDEGMRPMGDMDILVDKDKAFVARDILISIGAKPVTVPVSRWHEYQHGHVRGLKLLPWKTMIEIHSRLYSLGNKYQPPAMNWDSAIEEHSTTNGTFNVLSDAYLMYHLTTHLYYGYKMGGVRLGWLLDIALVLEKSEDAFTLIHDVLKINPKANNNILETIGWTINIVSPDVKSVLLRYEDYFTHFPDVKCFTEKEGDAKLHRSLLFGEFANTPGLINKIKGVWFQLFPSVEYMQHYYGVKHNRGVLKGYVKRLLG